MIPGVGIILILPPYYIFQSKIVAFPKRGAEATLPFNLAKFPAQIQSFFFKNTGFNVFTGQIILHSLVIDPNTNIHPRNPSVRKGGKATDLT